MSQMWALAVLSAAVGGAAAANNQHMLDPIVLDDSDAGFVGTQMFNATYLPCLKDAHGSGYHQGARESSLANYTFQPQVDGCYKIEEWHAGGQDQTCSKHLSEGVHLEVRYCKGAVAYTMLDQSQNGGQWNTLGALPFYVGWTGHFLIGGAEHNKAGHTCKAGTCFWASDAFRLTWIANSSQPCRIPEEEPEATPEAKPEALSTTTTTTTRTAFAMQAMFHDPDHGKKDSARKAPGEIQLAQTVVNDAVVMAESAWQVYTAGDRSQKQDFYCGQQGWMQNFLYLDPSAAQSTEVPASFTFDPPEDGCYLVEEFRPANTCSRRFSQETQLTIHYCRNQSLRVMLDQAEYGNQWNTVALLPFYVGHQGRVEVRHPQVGGELAVADAFRFTRVSASCHAAPVKLVEYARLKQHPVSITMDDSQAEKTGQREVRTCDAKALEGRAHAVAEEDDDASAKFVFLPPSTGCYRLDEFHPASSGDCRLAESAGIEVNYCLGARWEGSVSLHSNGGQWNPVGHFPFYAGVLGNVTSRRLPKSSGVWAADGFRFTKVADSCRHVPHSALVTLRITGVDLRAHELPDGQLTTHADLRLAFHNSIVVATGLKHQAVRLIGLRQGSIVAEFELTGDQADVFNAVGKIKEQLGDEAPLQRSLCAAAIVGADLAYEKRSFPDLAYGKRSCSVELLRSTAVPPPPPTEAEEESPDIVPIVIAVAAAAVLLVGFIALVHVLHRHQCCQKKKQPEAPKPPPMFDLVTEYKDAKDVKDNHSDSGSTATPPEVQDVEVMSLSECSAVMSCFEEQLSMDACSIHTPTHGNEQILA